MIASHRNSNRVCLTSKALAKPVAHRIEVFDSATRARVGSGGIECRPNEGMTNHERRDGRAVGLGPDFLGVRCAQPSHPPVDTDGESVGLEGEDYRPSWNRRPSVRLRLLPRPFPRNTGAREKETLAKPVVPISHSQASSGTRKGTARDESSS